MKLRNPFTKRSAYTLVEITLVLALAVIVVFVALRAFSQAQENSRVQQTASEIGQVRGAVESIYANQPDFSGLDAAAIIPSLPASQVTATTITDPFQGQVFVEPDKNVNANDSYDIIVGGLTNDACERLAVMDMGKSMVGVTAAPGDAAATTLVKGAGLTMPVTPTIATATGVCDNSASTYYVAFQFN
jgi:type II secretory pathway pseudopilin PulG